VGAEGRKPLATAAPERKPLARVVRRTDAERMDVRRTFRFEPADDAAWQEGAVAAVGLIAWCEPIQKGGGAA
jgi:hypothetical protein